MNKKKYVIKKSNEIERVLKNKNSEGNKYFSIHKYKNNETNNYRYAISVGKKYGNAPERNLMKRRLRSIVYINKNEINKYDFFIIVKPIAKNMSYDDIKRNIENLLKKNKIIGELDE